jgi:SAM-dependent methyltransferase
VTGLSESLGERLKQHKHLHRAARAVRFGIGHVLPPRRVSGIPGRIHSNDFMFIKASPDEIASYAARARNVIALIHEALAKADKTLADVDRWLDFGCGYGRVLRFLTQEVPPDRVVASDVIKEAVDFCRSEFGVAGIYSGRDLDAVRLGSYDFIYAISVITHLNERNSATFLQLIGEALNPGGIALFTTHGEWSLEHPGEYGPEYELRSAEIAEAVKARGIAYVRYPFVCDDYGMTWHSRSYIERQIAELHGGRLVPVFFRPEGLDGHQDVFAFRRVTASA